MAGAEYFVNNLVTRVRFNAAAKKIPKNALMIEIGPQPVLLSVLKRSIGSSGSYVSLMKKDEDNMTYFMEALGKYASFFTILPWLISIFLLLKLF